MKILKLTKTMQISQSHRTLDPEYNMYIEKSVKFASVSFEPCKCGTNIFFSWGGGGGANVTSEWYSNETGIVFDVILHKDVMSPPPQTSNAHVRILPVAVPQF